MEKKNRLSKAEAAKLILLLADRSKKQYKRALKSGKKPEKKFVLSKKQRIYFKSIIAEEKKK